MDAVEKNRDNNVPLEKKLDDLYKLIDGIDIAMLTTRRADGHLVSRPMSTQRRTTGTDLWFMTNVESECSFSLQGIQCGIARISMVPSTGSPSQPRWRMSFNARTD